ncbi:MAG TPA: hypothetical protein VFL28_05740 [bacterium]|nr:hypothetical protein [bacterium]
MEVDLERAKRALIHFGSAMEEAQGVVRNGRPGVVRFHTDDKVLEMPLTWAAAGLAAFALASMLTQLPSFRRVREEEPLGIG